MTAARHAVEALRVEHVLFCGMDSKTGELVLVVEAENRAEAEVRLRTAAGHLEVPWTDAMLIAEFNGPATAGLPMFPSAFFNESAGTNPESRPGNP